MTAQSSFVPQVIGVDVGSRWLDVAWPDGSHSRVENQSAGWSWILARAAESVLVMEATGIYYRSLAVAAVDAGVSVRVVNPFQVKAFAAARLTRQKTDKVDAKVIREYGVRMLDELRPWWPSPEALHRVQALVRLGDGLLKYRVAAGNRAHALRLSDPVVSAAAEPLAKVLRMERVRLMEVALEVARGDELVGLWVERLLGLPGVGQVSALRILAYAGDLRRFGTARQFAAFTGLPPRFNQSGLGREVGRMSRVGSRELRGVLFWCAMSAGQSRAPLGLRYRRLVESGKPRKLALVATANSLARAAWAVCVR